MVLSVFYKDGMKHRDATTITELFLSLKLVVFMALLTIGIVVILGWFGWLVEIIVFPRISKCLRAAIID